MSAARKSSRKRMGITTLISSIFIVASLVWATYNFVIVQSGAVRQYDPHYEYDEIPYWPYNNDFAGGRTNWFENTNYTDVLLNPPLPDDILDHLDDVIFTVGPADPPQLWRVGAYDDYDGSNWGKTNIGTWPVDNVAELITYGEATNQVYTVAFNATAGATVGAMELPTLFPYIRVIEDSFTTWSFDVDGNPYPDPGRLLDYDLETDAYGTLLFTPFIQGTTGEEVIVTFDLSFDTQDIGNVVANALPGPGVSQGNYLDYPVLTPEVEANISQFSLVGSNAYEKAMAVQLYFQSTFELLIDAGSLSERPGTQEVTDWFLERGGGLPQDFATAYCVFMRYLGVQSRFAMGYAVGEPDPTNSYRTLQVRHMTFWAEVFIPMSGGGGEWIQVIPAMWPGDMGGGEDPTNTPTPDIELIVWPTNGQPWEQIGTPFELSAAITIDDVPVITPELIVFNDETDGVFIGSQTIGQPLDNPIANVTHTFPTGATIDYHIISASWTTSTFSITNYTSVYAVGTPDPLSNPTAPIGTGEFILSETTELNVSQGLDEYTAFWEDTVHVYGTMKTYGVPVNSSNHDNRNIGIYWDNTFMGNATIDEYGYYELDIFVDPMDLARMTVGDHAIWSWYLGDWDQDGQYWRLFEARSSNNSTITVWGRVGFDLYVTPTAVSAGATIDYDGIAYLLNSTVLPMSQQVGVFFSTQANATPFLNATGGFSWSYPIPITQSDGSYFAYANWTSPWPLIKGNWSYSIEIIVGSSGTQLSIIPLPNPLYVSQNITIQGFLTHFSNGTGIGGRWVDIYWNNGSDYLLQSVLTAPNGYYQFNYTILESDEGPIEYWTSFGGEPLLAPTESDHYFTYVKKIDVSLDTIFVTPDPVHVLQPIDIQGNLTFPEFPTFLFANEWVDFWLQNSTGVYYIGSDLTNSTGGYFYQYTIPIGQAIEIVYIWANYTSPYYTVYNGGSLPEPLSVEATGTLISIQEDFTFYYVNETIFLYGNLQFSNGTPIQDEIVNIYWTNASGTFVFPKTTDTFGNFQMFYNCTPTQDEPGAIDVDVTWTSWNPSIVDDASSSVAPQIQLQRYDLEITLIVPSQVFVDQLTVWYEGVLSYMGGFPSLPGETLTIYWDNGTHLLPIDFPVTNSTGGFVSSINFTQYTLGDYDFWANYQSPDLLHNDAWQYFQITRLNYTINVDITVNPNPVMQNGTITVYTTLTFSHNGTALSGADVLILWYNGTWYGLDFITTDGTGQGNLSYSGMSYDNIRSGIEIYGYYAGSQITDLNVSYPVFLTLNQWQTTLTGVSLPPGPYRIGETIVVTGNLEYVNGSIPYGGVTVELTLLGITRTTDVTASDGSFTLSWDIPGTLLPMSYSFIVEFNSPYPWIANSSFVIVPSTDVIAPGYLWPEFDVTPTTVYLDQSLTITGRIIWDNGTPYANSPVDIYWGDYFSTANTIIVNDYLTDGTGRFTIIYPIPDDLGLLTYVQHVWAYIDPVGYATFGESPVIPIVVDIYQASLTTAVDLTVVYLGGTLTFSGTLQFTNTTPLVGYNVEIWWGGNHLTTITIVDLAFGAFSYPHPVPYSNAIGDLSGYAMFRAPSIAWGDSDTSLLFPVVTVIELVDVSMDPEPVDNVVSRGDTLVVTGDVLNDGGFDADGVTVEVLADGGATGSFDVTAGDGSFSISLFVPTDATPGVYNISVWVTSTYHQLRNGPEEWTIQVFIDAIILVDTELRSYMPGETFSVYIELYDDTGVPLDDEWVTVNLGLTYIADVQMTIASGMSFDFAVPLSWSEGNGFFNVTVDFAGSIALFINPGSAISANSVHVFEDVVFISTPSRVDPGQPFNIDCSLRDPDGNPIMFRRADLDYNSTDVYPYFVDDTGTFTHIMPAQRDGTVITFRIVLVSFDISNIQSNEFTINIETTGGNPLQGTDLLIASILLVGAVVAVLAYLYIVRGMFRSPTISRGIDIPTKLRNIKKLADAGKYGASITLAYRTFEQMCGTKMGAERTHSETAREFLDRVLQTISLDGATVEQFVQTYEEARFSHHEMTRERYEEAVRIFTDLYPRIDSSAPIE